MCFHVDVKFLSPCTHCSYYKRNKYGSRKEYVHVCILTVLLHKLVMVVDSEGTLPGKIVTSKQGWHSSSAGT